MTDRSLRLTFFVHVFLFALVVGVFWGTWFSLSRSMSSITASTFLEVGHTMIDNLGGPMAVLMPATLVSAVPVLFMLYRLHRRASFSLILVGAALLVAALVITQRERSDRLCDRSMDRRHTSIRLDEHTEPVGGLSRRSHVHQPGGFRIRPRGSRVVA
jgi:hypothetical protein